MNRNIIFIIILGLAIAMVVMNKGKEEIMIAPPVAHAQSIEISQVLFESIITIISW